MIRFDALRVSFDDHVALQGLDLDIGEGEFFTLLGPSGCGKTTALRSLAGFVEPTSGTLHIDGRDVTRVPSERRGVGMVFQSYALFPSMSVRENIAFGLSVQRVPRDEQRRRVDEVAAQVGLRPQQLTRGVAELSGGQQQRVAIARALVLQPRILLLDEPLSNLDAKLRVQLRGELQRLQREVGITTVYVTHDQEEALALSDRIAVLSEGRLEQVGTPREIYEQPASAFVCDFIGEATHLSAEQRAALAGAGVDAGRDAWVRPEHVSVTAADDRDPAESGSGDLPAVVLSCAYRGSTTLVELEAAGARLLASVPSAEAARVEVGDRVRARVEVSAVHQYGAAA
ncbi:ATP-binding cassette domain-containing protein [Auraticoccus sp. F435]|uniref:ATP-binding cassette domain-containing protein n=1 Tax=Auraticoccus cholistanensis TaxID=2656650 RepID=A0A6A9V1C8_9ACTN|nr:ABC transporter ATP-binding protein [Auraticoccus cholistanensis]MVA77179.1 ATP-binding cassette domain-containing protein [Auraticoccus cholistanensis]